MTGAVRIFRSALPAALAMLVAAGCNGSATATTGGIGPPIAPSPDAGLAERWYYDWEEEGDLLVDGQVRDMLFSLSTRGRDWREPEGPDGFPVRVFLLDVLGRPVRGGGSLRAFLVQWPHDPAAKKGLYAWSIEPEQAQRCFRQDKVPGYLMRLDWGEAPPGRDGEFMLVIRWISSDGKHRVTRNLVFQDRIRHETTTTTRPQRP